jgi:uncharacterized membrane protein YdjX (TVP38/TMEM64 family)
MSLYITFTANFIWRKASKSWFIYMNNENQPTQKSKKMLTSLSGWHNSNKTHKTNIPVFSASWSRRIHIFSLFGILSFVALCLILHVFWRFDMQLVLHYLEQHPFLAPFLFVVLYSTLSVVLISALPLNLCSGFLWGAIEGGILSTIGATFGASIAFLISRYLFKECLSRNIDNRFLQWMNRTSNTNGIMIVAFLRLTPIVPTGPLNFLCGVTSMNFRQYLFVTAFFLCPSSIYVAFIGSSLGKLVLYQDSANLATSFFLFSITAPLILGVFLTLRYYIKKKLDIQSVENLYCERKTMYEGDSPDHDAK